MKEFIQKLIVLSFAVVLIGCGDTDISLHKNETPKMNFQEFFRGKLKGNGVIENWSGEVIKTFEVTLTGVWSDGNGIITENIKFNDNAELNRTWQVAVNIKGQYIANSSDVIGNALGFEIGNAVQFNYELKVPFYNKILDVSASNQMIVLKDGTIFGKDPLKKVWL